MKCKVPVGHLLYFVIFLRISSLITLSQELDTIPYVDFNLPTIQLCKDSTLTFTNLGDTSNTYSWQVNNVIVSGAYNLTIPLQNTGINIIKLTVDSNGYTNSIIKQIKIETPPGSFQFIKNDTAVCQHSTVNYTIYSSNKSISYELWDIGTNLLIDNSYGNGNNLVLHRDSIANTGSCRIIGLNTCASKNYGSFKTRVKQTPAVSLSFNFQDTLFCNSGIPELEIRNTESSVNYKVYYYSNLFLSQAGNGGNLTFVLPETGKTKTYDIVSVSTVSGCQRKFTSAPILVDTVISGISLSQLNPYINEPLKCFDNSYGNHELHWTITDHSEMLHFNSKNVSHAFTTPGFKKIKLLNETEFGCKDSSEKQIFVHDTSNYLKSGWSINGSRIETWRGNLNPPSFAIDKQGSSYIAGEFEVNTNTTLLSSFKGIDLITENAETGAILAKYDKYGLLKWQNRFIGQESPDVGCIRVVHDSVVFLSLSHYYPIELISIDGNSITIKEKNIIALFDMEGYLIRYFSVNKPVISIEVDHDGSLYFLEYDYSIHDPSPCVLTRFSSALDSIWSVKFTHSDNMRKPQIDISVNGDVYVVGTLDNDMNVVAGNGTFTIPYSKVVSGSDIFFFRINAKGNYKWGNTGFTKVYAKSDNGVDVASDHLGNVYITGRPTNGTFYLSSSDSSTFTTDVRNYFLAKYDSSGNYVWCVGAKMSSISGYWVGATRMLSDSNNIYVIGYVKDDCIFNSTNHDTAYSFINNASEHLFIAQYDLNGVLQRIWKSKNRQLRPLDIALDQESNSYFFTQNNSYEYNFEIQNASVALHKEEYLLTKLNKGYFSDTIIIDDSLPVNYCKNELMPIVFNHTDIGFKVGYQAELSDHEGSFKNSIFLGNVITSNGNDTIIGKIPGNIQRGDKYRIRVNNVTKGIMGKIYSHDLSIQTITPDLKTIELSLVRGDSVLIGNKYRSTQGEFYDTLYSSTSCDSKARFIITYSAVISVSECDHYVSPSGKYVWTETGTYYDTIPGCTGHDSIVTINLTINKNLTSQVLDVCNEFVSPSGKYVWKSSGVYQDTLTNVFGCDSIITVVLTVTTIDTSVTITEHTLVSDDYGSLYQWLDCNNNYTILSGQNQQNYTPDGNGCFSVEIEKNGCIDTSSCYYITVLNTYENNRDGLITIYPNPSSGKIFVNFQKIHLFPDVTITDLTGKKVNAGINYSDQKIIIEINEGPGIYFLMITTENKTEVFKLIKK